VADTVRELDSSSWSWISGFDSVLNYPSGEVWRSSYYPRQAPNGWATPVGVERRIASREISSHICFNLTVLISE